MPKEDKIQAQRVLQVSELSSSLSTKMKNHTVIEIVQSQNVDKKAEVTEKYDTGGIGINQNFIVGIYLRSSTAFSPVKSQTQTALGQLLLAIQVMKEVKKKNYFYYPSHFTF